jgi:hypothetical protein
VSLPLACSHAWRAGVALVILLLAAPCWAQTAPAPSAATPAEPPGYREAIDEAVAEYGAGRYPEARALFTRAHALQPSARTLRGLGMAEFELRGYVEAARLLQEALSSTVRPLDGELRTATEALLARARAFIGRFALSLTPPDLQLSVNGAPARVESDRTLALPVGDHALHAQAQGYLPISHTLRVNGGESLSLNITLQSEQAAPVAAAPAQPPPQAVTPTSSTPPRDDEGGSVLSSPWFWTAAAVIVVGAGVGVGFVLLSEDAETEAPHGGSTGIVLGGP